MMRCFRGNRDENETETAAMRNGRLLLEKSIAINNGRGNPIRCFSTQDLNNATNNYDQSQMFFYNRFYGLYKGFLQERPVIVKRYKEDENLLQNCMSDIVFSSQMSVHKNVLKLLGCCLESPIPILVYEVAEKGTLHDCIILDRNRTNFQPLSWKNRLKIAVDVANAIAYLHTAFPRPIVHRDIKSTVILLDEECRAKLSDFSLSISIPEGETHIQDENVIGTLGYLAPEYLSESKFNEKIDVYSFGILLLVLLTEKTPNETSNYDPDLVLVKSFEKCMEEYGMIDNFVDPKIVEEGPWLGKEQQLRVYARLALQCLHYRAEDRPDITDVGKQLRQIYQSLISTGSHQN
ncbi:serine/threonine-protein kinase ZRK1 [Manihot esculenta]|uniref:Protein kinase domain-containing protein n=4 Tax=Manihot esculenta TaxID=3983 RepID=A0A2C9VBI2_MANES|nr:serine/threonine-protein kinase ZRK1 [Manihot esculenta]XP_021622572.1 serine/threonine-protein kinase ZRK1 [Manihot esculenta]KAG8648274.1 hypothetical protein MANES_09G168200v8 [Manihot esculenta]OAY42293.1 hypothetical protein MANES_09G168200v8 [Manihot esculenta]